MKIKYLPNIFDRKENQEFEVEYKCQTVKKYFKQVVGKRLKDHSAIIAGKKVEWDHIPCKHDEIIFVVDVKDSVVSTVFGVVLTAIGFFVPGMQWLIPMGVGLMLGGVAGMLMQPNMPTMPSINRAGFDKSQTYSWDGIKNIHGEGNPVPVIYGEHKMGGLLVEGFVDGESESGTQQRKYMNTLLAMSEGPIFGIDTSTIKINNSDLSQFSDDVEYWTKTGEVGQTAIANFSKIARHYQLQSTVKIANGASNAYTYQTYNAVDSAKVSMYFPTVFGSNEDTGDIIENTVEMRVEYALQGSEVWSVATGGNIQVNGKTKSPIEHDVQITFPSNAIWKIKVSRVSEDFDSDPYKSGDSYLKSVVEYENATLTYPYTALLGLRIKATDKLSGAMPNITAVVQGRQIPNVRDLQATPTLADSKNPANIVYDLLTNKRYGLGWYYDQGTFQIDMDSLESFADWCDETVDYEEYNPATGQNESKQQKRYEMNLVLDTSHKALDIINKICANCRAIPYWSGDKFKVVIEKEQATYAQIFSMGNIVADSFEETYIGGNDIPSQAEAQFLDEDNDFKTNLISGVDEGRIGEGAQPNIQNMFGITNKARIKRELAYALRKAKALTKFISFRGSIDTIVCEVGDLIRVQHDIPGYGLGGRLISASGQVATLDRNVSLTAGNQYSLRIRLPNNSTIRYDWTASGDYIGNVIDVGQVLDLTITENCIWQFGEIGIESKPFRVTSIVEAEEYQFELYATEYNSSIFTDDNSITVSEIDYSRLGKAETYTINGTIADPHPAQGDPTYEPGPYSGQDDMPPNVDSVTLYEELKLIGNVYRSDLIVNFTPVEMESNSIARVVRYDVIYSTDAGVTWAKHGEVKNGGYYRMPDVDVGLTYYVHIKPYTNFDITNHIELTSNKLANGVTIQGKTAAPNEPTNLAASGDTFMVRLSWTKPTDRDLDLIEIHRSGDNNRANAEQIGTSEGTRYIDDGLAPADTYYYWVRSLDTSGNYSAWHPASATGGVTGSPDADPAKVLAQLESAITESQLAQALADKINSGDMSTVVTLLENQWTVKITENDHVAGAGIIMYPDHDTLKTDYAVGDMVAGTDSNIYKCLVANTTNAPPHADWEEVQYGAKSEFIILADKFAIIRSDGTGGTTTPFIVGTIDGVTNQVGINGNLNVDGSILARHIDANAITAEKIAAGAITAEKIATSAITTDKIVSSAITADKIGTNEIITSAANIQDAIITGAKIGDAQVNTLQIADNAVTVPVMAFSTSDTGALSPGDEIASITIDAGGQPIMLWFALTVTSFGNQVWYWALQKNGTTLKTWGGDYTGWTYTNYRFADMWADPSPGSGSQTYKLIQHTGTSAGCIDRVLYGIGCKK